LLDGFVLLSIGLNLTEADWTPAGLWLAVVASGIYHGVNPGMGWPLAVSAGLIERSSYALVMALWPLTVGHLLAMFVVMLPFALLLAVVEWQQQIQIGASLVVIGFGIFRFVNRRHPRVLARIRPTQLGLWSFAVAIAHGAGLMLVPIYLGLCQAADLDKGHGVASALINANLGMAVLVSLVHSIAMIVAGGFLAWLVYRYLGLKFVSRSWFNLDATWAYQKRKVCLHAAGRRGLGANGASILAGFQISGCQCSMRAAGDLWRPRRFGAGPNDPVALVCRESSILRGDGGSVMTVSPSRPEARRRFGS
jgi:hypothetical protein